MLGSTPQRLRRNSRRRFYFSQVLFSLWIAGARRTDAGSRHPRETQSPVGVHLEDGMEGGKLSSRSEAAYYYVYVTGDRERRRAAVDGTSMRKEINKENCSYSNIRQLGVSICHCAFTHLCSDYKEQSENFKSSLLAMATGFYVRYSPSMIWSVHAPFPYTGM